MAKKPDKKNNNISKSINHIITQAKNGSKLHIGMIIGAVAIAVLALVLLMGAVGGGNDDIVDDYVENEIDQSYDKDRESLDVEQLGNTILEETEDAGQEYIDGTLFIGDSNTVRTQVYGHTTWDNVVAAVSMGVQHITSLEMTYFKGYDKPVTVPAAVKIIQPQRIIITYGTNNTIGYEVEDFIKIYKQGLAAIEKAYPYADIIINSIPPIDKERENLAITMQTIDKMNKALSEMAKEEDYKFINSAEALKDEKTGFAKKDYTIGDGVHLSKKGMDAMFEYFRTHAYITEDTRPKPLKKVPEREETPTGVITEDPIAVRGTRIKIVFQSSDTALGKVEGEVEQKIKRTITSQAVKAVPVTENGGIFTGWSCSYDGLSSTTSDSVTFTVPKVDDNVTEIVITANFAKASVAIKDNGQSVKNISVEKGGTKQLGAEVSSGFAGDRKITWASEDESIVTIDEKGLLTAVSGGKTQIIASILGDKIYTVCEVTVTEKLAGISISGESNMQTGSTTQLSLDLSPAGASADKNNAVWASSDESVATVAAGGKVTAHKDGTVTITATLDGFTASHKLTVSAPKPLTGISLSGRTELFEGEKTQLSVAYTPADTTDSKTATWSSNNTAVASVVDGTVVANSAGTAEITCTVGSCTATITITVKVAETQPTPSPDATPEVTPTPEASPTPERTPVPEATPEPTPTPVCPVCGATDHTTHPTCGVCGSTEHIAHPTCATCGSTEHTEHPAESSVKCAVCGSADHESCTETTQNNQ